MLDMTDRIGFEVDPGIELRAALRGPRLSLGPRIDRVGPDGAPDPWAQHRAAWSAAAGGGLLPEPAPSGRRARRRKEQEWQTIHDHLVAVTTMHERPVARASTPAIPRPEIDRDEIRRALMAEATDGLSSLDLVGRSRVRKATRPYLDDAVEERVAELEAAADDEQRELRAWWQRLTANDPATVREHLTVCLERHRFAAAVATVESDRVHLVVPVAKPSALVGDREPTTEPGGHRTLPKMTKERRHEVYETAIGSGLASTFAEVFAVCPSIGRVACLVVAPEHVGGPAVLVGLEVTRGLVLPDPADRSAIDGVRDVEEAQPDGRGAVVIDRGDVSGALRPLDHEHPDVAGALAVLRTELTS